MNTHIPPAERMCHHTGFTQSCRELVGTGKCNRWFQIMGNHPQTGESMNIWDCVDNVMPALLIENSQMQRQTGAAIESFRNIMVQLNGKQVEDLNVTTYFPEQVKRDKLLPKGE